MSVLTTTDAFTGVKAMNKEQRNSRENKKKAALTPKEKRAAKKSKKKAKAILGSAITS